MSSSLNKTSKHYKNLPNSNNPNSSNNRNSSDSESDSSITAPSYQPPKNPSISRVRNIPTPKSEESNAKMSNNTQSFPPIRLGASRQVSQEEAAAMLAEFHTKAKTNPMYLPNAKLLNSGPSAQGTSDGGVTMHNVSRLQKGLAGEILAPSLEVEGFGSKSKDDDAMEGVELEKNGKKTRTAEEIWAEEGQDVESFQREQEIDEGEIGASQAGDAVVSRGPPKIQATGGAGSSQVQSSSQPQSQAPPSQAAAPAVLDKEARKAAKKARAKEEKKVRELQMKEKKKSGKV